MLVIYIPRGEYVLLRLELADVSKGGVALPERSGEAHRWIVKEVGDEVEDLRPGMRVQLMGEVGQDIARVPGDEKLYITKQSNILLIVKEEQ